MVSPNFIRIYTDLFTVFERATFEDDYDFYYGRVFLPSLSFLVKNELECEATPN